MTESEAIKELETSIDLAKMCTQNYERKNEIQGYEMAIKALEEVQQYQALEKRLSDMFGGSLSLKMCVDELERILVEPDSPHPMNAKILTYQEAADWEAYRAIGTPEECRVAVKMQMESRVLHQGHYDKIEGTIQTCRIIYSADIECLCNQKRYNEAKELEEDMNIMISAMEKQVPKKPTDRCMYKECPACGEVEIEFCKYCPSCGQKLDWRNE